MQLFTFCNFFFRFEFCWAFYPIRSILFFYFEFSQNRRLKYFSYLFQKYFQWKSFNISNSTKQNSLLFLSKLKYSLHNNFHHVIRHPRLVNNWAERDACVFFRQQLSIRSNQHHTQLSTYNHYTLFDNVITKTTLKKIWVKKRSSKFI